MNNTDNRLKEVRERLENITQGKWQIEKYYYEEDGFEHFVKSAAIVTSPDEENCRYTITRNDWSNPCFNDLNFISNSPDDINFLLNALEQSQDREQVLREALTRIYNATAPDRGLTMHEATQIYCIAREALKQESEQS